MKHLEKFTTVNSGDIENWNPKDILEPKTSYTGTKNLNFEIGKKVEELLKEYGLCVSDVGPGDWLKQQDIVLKSEKIFKEYRVHLGIIIPWEDFLDSSLVDGIKSFDNLTKKEKKELEDEYESSKMNDDTRLEFSVFLPAGIQNYNLTFAALSDASNYLLMLNNCIPQIFDGNMIEDCLKDEPKNFKCFLNSKDLKITNDNIEDVNSINYRIYKDSKFFLELEDVLKNNTKFFINDWLNLLK